MEECNHDCSSCSKECSSRDLKIQANELSNVKLIPNPPIIAPQYFITHSLNSKNSNVSK